jgi:hypothetical protein
MVISKRVLFGTGNIKHCVSISVNDIITLALCEINKVDDLLSILINIRIILSKPESSEGWVNHVNACSFLNWPVLSSLP